MELDALRQTALEAARRAGEVLLGGWGRVKTVRTKSGPTDLVTEYDDRAQEVILDLLRQRVPEHAVLAEEDFEQRTDSPYRWVIDPLDGTTNFAHSNPFFCVSIGLERDGHPELGVVYAPWFKEWFVAVRGQGATLNGRPLRLTQGVALPQALLATSFSYHPEKMARNLRLYEYFAQQAQALRRQGAAALDLCWVAAGRLDGFWGFDLKPWDIAAGRLIVAEAGGLVSDLAGGPPGSHDGEIVACNGSIHAPMIAVLNEEEK